MATSKSSTSTGAHSMAELMAKMGSSVRTLQKGDIVEGIIKKLTPKEILLDIGAKGDALVIEYDRRNLENLLSLLKVGDRVKAVVISAESEEGFPVVSLRRMLDDLIFTKFESTYKDNNMLKVQVTEATRGGFFAEAEFGTKGFLPHSQIMPEVGDSEKELIGREVEVKIIEFDRAKKRVIFSQKATQYTISPAELDKFYKKGQTVSGKINTITSYGIYLSLIPQEGILVEGFIHISEVSYARVENLQSLFKIGANVTAQVLEIDHENRRVNLSLKSLQKDAFAEAAEKYKKEQKVKGTVKDVKARGVTLTLEDGILGFIPGAKVPTDTTYEVGQEVEAEVSDFDVKHRMIVLTPVLKKTFVGYR